MARVTRTSWLFSENQFRAGPASVEARNQMSFPPLSKTGSETSERPSVIGYDFCAATS